VTPPEARFCRHCGAPLRTVATFGNDEPISPLAQTVPLSGEGLTTSNLGADEDGGTASDTRRVARAEMEQLLRRARFEVQPDGRRDGDGTTAVISDYAAPPTGELRQEAPSQVAVSAPAHSAQRAAVAARPRRSWALVTALLLLATLSGALLAYYFLRQRTTENAANVTNAANSNQPAEAVNANSAVAEAGVEAAGVPEAGPQAEETPQPSPRPSASVEQARAKRERGTETAVLQATPTPTPTASPVAQATPTEATAAPSPATTTNNSNGGTETTQASSDSFYFQAVNLVNGRDARSLSRAELLRALQLFQNVRSGPHVAEARKQAARLGREFDRLNKQSQR
jgi:hypothetical protein